MTWSGVFSGYAGFLHQ